jgi:hypothetical protein
MPNHQQNRMQIERRRCQRRDSHERREMIRFELNKEPRRSIRDRRASVDVWARRHII